MITSESDMKNYLIRYNYIVVFPDKKVELFTSLRKIQDAICIDSSTISKKLKDKDYNYFQARGSDFIFFIHKIRAE